VCVRLDRERMKEEGGRGSERERERERAGRYFGEILGIWLEYLREK
jgi:hypothetical protein